MRPSRLVALALVAMAASLSAPAAQAALVTFDFANPVADTPSSAFVTCPAPDRCATTMDFEKDGLGLTASVLAGAANAGIFQDLDPTMGGLGIVDSFRSGSHSGNDNVSSGETILLTFDAPVLLLSVGFFDDHESLPHSFPSGADVLVSINGSSYVSYPLAGALHAVNGRVVDFGAAQGTTFAFKHAGQDKDDFYIGKVTVDPVTAPEPGSLVLLGLGMLGLAGRLRRRSRG